MTARRSLVLVLAATAACAGPPPPADEPMPFRVSCPPVVVRRLDSLLPAPDALHISLDLRSDDTTRALRAALDRRVFAAVTTSPTALTTLEAQADAAARQGADLLLCCELEYAPAIQAGRDDQWLLVLGLHFLGPWWCYLWDDVAYRFTAELRIRLYDLTLWSSSRPDRRREQALLENWTSEVTDLSLAFTDRAANAGHYLLTLLVPSGFLGWDGEAARQSLQRRIVAALADKVAQRLRRRQRSVLAPTRVPFFLRPNRYRVHRLDDGRLAVTAELAHAPRQPGDTLHAYTLEAPGAAPVHGFFGPSQRDDPGTGLHLYRLTEILAAPAGTTEVRLTVWEQSRSAAIRSFTLPVEHAAAGVPPRP